MCLAVPGQILSIQGTDTYERSGEVRFGGIVKAVNLALLPEACVGDYVIVHAGFGISVLDQGEAETVFEYIRQMEEAGRVSEDPS